MDSGCKRSRRTDDLNTPWFCDDGCNGLQNFHVHARSFNAGGWNDICDSRTFDMELQQIDLVVRTAWCMENHGLEASTLHLPFHSRLQDGCLERKSDFYENAFERPTSRAT